MSLRRCLILILAAPLLSACDPQPKELKDDPNAFNVPLEKVAYFESGSRNFQIEIIKYAGNVFRLSLIEDGSSTYAAGDRYFDITSANTAYPMLESLFNGSTKLYRYENPCPLCLAGYWHGYRVTVMNNEEGIDVDVDVTTRLKLENLIEAAYLKINPPFGTYLLVARYCLSGALVNDDFDFLSDVVTLDFVSATQINRYAVIGGVTTDINYVYTIVGTTLTMGGESVTIHKSHGLYSGTELVITAPPIIGSGGSCPAGDQLVSIYQRSVP